MSSNGDRYPRRGEHGDPTPVCEWCGKRVDLPRAWREHGTYCSTECQAADRRGYYICSLVCSLVFLIVSLVAIIAGYQVIPFSGLALFSIIWVLYSKGMVDIGRRVVQSQTVPIDKAELEEVCSALTMVLQMNKTAKGVSRKVLYADLRSYGFTNRTIKSGIEHMLVSGKIRSFGIGRYVLV